MKEIRSIGFPFYRTDTGLLNPVNSVYLNAKCKLLNLLSTVKGLRILSNNCLFGLDIKKYLFLNEDKSIFLKRLLLETIQKWIKLINYVNILVKKILNIYNLTVNYKVNLNYDTLYLELNINE